jgi:hypothetical protein
MLIFVEGGKPENPEKNPRGKGENQLTTQAEDLTHDPLRGEPATPPMPPLDVVLHVYLILL